MQKKKTILRFSIILKLFVVFLSLTAIFYFTTFSIFIQIKSIVGIARSVVTTKFEITSATEKMIDSLLGMEENQKKFFVLRKDEYKGWFQGALDQFGKTLAWIQTMPTESPEVWKELGDRFQEKFRDYLAGGELPEEPWIEEGLINEWIGVISKARLENERSVETRLRELYALGQEAGRLGNLGLVAAVAVGLVGSFFLSWSISRPLRELRRGIRQFASEGPAEPVRVLSRDELGELAQAFNEMASRLKAEENMRSDFISMLSHEIRTPLTSIRESVNLIREEVLGPVNERQAQFLEIAGGEIDRISNLLRRLMQASSMAQGGVEVSPVPLDPAVLVAGSVNRLLPAAKARNISLLHHADGGLPQVLGDIEHLQQALLNLIGNAIKFSPPGSEVTVTAEPSPPGEIMVRVKDNGPGIPPEEQPHVFHRYFRGSTLKHEVDGIGLGLNITKQIIEAHGGHIWVESRPGEGSSFSFTLRTAA